MCLSPSSHLPLSQATTDIGPHYAVTLREWREAWEQRREEVLALGYSDRFWRKYRYGGREEV